MGIKKKPDMAKGKRKLMTDDIANFQRLNPFPAPNAFLPDFTKIKKNLSGTSYKTSDKRASLSEES